MDTANVNVGFAMHIGTNKMFVQHKKLAQIFTIQEKIPVNLGLYMNINEWFKNKFNWEGSQYSLDTLAMGDFEPSIFNTDPTLLFKKLKEHPIYPTLFKQAFGIENIDALSYHELKKTIAQSIAQYLRSGISANSKFDKFNRKEGLLNQMEY